MIKRGNYIVSSEKSSNYNTRLISENKSNNELIENIKHWTKSVLIITHCLQSENQVNDKIVFDKNPIKISEPWNLKQTN